MLVNLVDILKIAEEKKYAIGAFNVPTLEAVWAVIGSAEKLGLPVILNHLEGHEYVAPLDQFGPILLQSAKAAKVPVCVHLDHCEHLDYMERALAIGFTGVMYDGSTLPYAENIENTRIAVKMAHAVGAGVESELGALPAREGDSSSTNMPTYTEPEEALDFCQKTGIDALAPSFGTAHGIYKVKPVLDLDRVRRVSEATHLPLVMHGGSGVSPEDYRIGIRNGLRKINYYSYMAKDGTNAVKERLASENVTFYHDLAYTAQHAMAANAEKAMRIFAGIEASAF